MPDIREKIKRICDDSTVSDFQECLLELLENDETMNSRIESMLAKYSARGSGEYDTGLLGVSKIAPAIFGMWRMAKGDQSYIDKFNSFLVTPNNWSDSGPGWVPGGGGQKAALGTALRSDAVTGSYLAPTQTYADILHLARQASICADKVTKIPMSVKEVKVPYNVTQISLAWPTDQSSAKTETNPTFDLHTMTAKTCAGWMTWTDEFEEDAALPVAEWFMDRFAEAWGREIDTQVLTANAAPFTGILHDTNVNVVTMGAGKTSFSDVSWTDLIDLENAVTSEEGHVGAGYIMSRYVFNILRKLKDDNGNPIFQPPAGQEPGSINGKTYLLSEVMPGAAADAPSTAFIIYGNLRHWLWGERIGMDMRVYRDTVRAIDYDQIFLRFRVRAAFSPGLPAAISRLRTAA